MKRKSKLGKITPVVMGVCMLTFVAACGSDDDSSSSSTPPQQEESQEGQYAVTFSPLNPTVGGTIAGNGNFVISSDIFGANLNVTGARTGTHLQHVYAGRACPTPASDTNGDGFVDFVEANAILGGILIPLDSDLSTQAAGGSFPSGANYVYAETASLSQMLGDLTAVDDNPTDALVKLAPGESLNLEGRVIQIHGVPASTNLPTTVQGAGGATPADVLPIACGVIVRVDGGTTTGGTATGGTATGGTATGGTATGGTSTGGLTGI